jgi:hypothetical protein
VVTMGLIPVAMTYYGLLMGTRGTHQGLWSTDFMAYSLEPVNQDDVKKYTFLLPAALNTKFEVIHESTAAEAVRLGFNGKGVDNQPLLEISLSVLSNVWNPAIIREQRSGDWGEDQFRGVLKKETRWGSDKDVYWESTGALLLSSFMSFNELDYNTQYTDMKKAIQEVNPGSSASSLLIFDRPELYPGDLDQAILSQINMDQDERAKDKNAEAFARKYQLESLFLKNDTYSQILINPDLSDNGIDFNSSNLYGELVEEDSDHDIPIIITRDKATFAQWVKDNQAVKDKKQKLVGAYLDTDCYSISDAQSCPLNIAITGIDDPLVGALYIAENNSHKARIPVFINTDIAVKTLVIPFDKTFSEGEAFHVVLENFSDRKVDDLGLQLPDGLHIDANQSSCLKDGGVAKRLCEFVVYGAENLSVGDHKIDVLIDHSKFKTIVLQVEE